MADDDIITGSWCSGSTLPKDLLPVHIEAARRVLDWSEDRRDIDQDELEKAKRELENIERRMPSDGDPYFDSDDARVDLDTLGTILHQFAPQGYYWGPLRANPTNFGYWKHD